ncbi:Hypothetical Protein RSKD131_3112 [Cereibacter sphaeroides KD131]|nr:Hypothetical Protein RSKD131_3112 [Cereibacter sphaeroides KD131]
MRTDDSCQAGMSAETGTPTSGDEWAAAREVAALRQGMGLGP